MLLMNTHPQPGEIWDMIIIIHFTILFGYILMYTDKAFLGEGWDCLKEKQEPKQSHALGLIMSQKFRGRSSRKNHKGLLVCLVQQAMSGGPSVRNWVSLQKSQHGIQNSGPKTLRDSNRKVERLHQRYLFALTWVYGSWSSLQLGKLFRGSCKYQRNWVVDREP